MSKNCGRYGHLVALCSCEDEQNQTKHQQIDQQTDHHHIARRRPSMLLTMTEEGSHVLAWLKVGKSWHTSFLTVNRPYRGSTMFRNVAQSMDAAFETTDTGKALKSTSAYAINRACNLRYSHADGTESSLLSITWYSTGQMGIGRTEYKCECSLVRPAATRRESLGRYKPSSHPLSAK